MSFTVVFIKPLGPRFFCGGEIWQVNIDQFPRNPMSDPLNGPRKKTWVSNSPSNYLRGSSGFGPNSIFDGKKWWFSKKRTSINWVVPLNIRIRIPYFLEKSGWLMGLMKTGKPMGFWMPFAPNEAWTYILVEAGQRRVVWQAFPTLIAWGLPGVPSLGRQCPCKTSFPFRFPRVFFGGV